jgi:hypothetical protein
MLREKPHPFVSTFLFFTILFSCSVSWAQSLENVDFVTDEHGNIFVAYDLLNCPKRYSFDVSLHFTHNDEHHQATSIDGDVANIKEGYNHIIVWSSLSDLHELKGSLQVEVRLSKIHRPKTNFFANTEEIDSAFVLTIAGKSPLKEVQISRIPKPTAPAVLDVRSTTFSDADGNGNQILDAGEEAIISLYLVNKGKGAAYNLLAEVKEIGAINDLTFSHLFPIGNLNAQSGRKVNIPLKGGSDLKTGTCQVEIKITEGNNFDADPVTITFQTQKFKHPTVAVVDQKWSSSTGDKIRLGEPAYLEVAVQNTGQGRASDVVVDFKLPENTFPVNETRFQIEKLDPGESSVMSLEFFTNKKFQGTKIPIEVIVREAFGKYGETRKVEVPMNEYVASKKEVIVKGQETSQIQIQSLSLTSSVDKEIPEISRSLNESKFALVIGNEDYKKHQSNLNNDQNVAYAKNDALILRQYLIKTLGFPERQVFTVTDATSGQMRREINRLVELAKITPKSEIFFYYAGHGLPDNQTREGYLIPVDITAANLSDGIGLKELYEKLASANSEKVTVVLDACFSGGGRGEAGLVSARTVKVKPKGPILAGNIVAVTATSDEELSFPLHKESHGLFTYYFLKKLKETRGEVSLAELMQYLQHEVPKASLIENPMKQTPQVLIAPGIEDKWQNWKF